MAIELNEYQVAFVLDLQEANISFLVVGGIAMRAHGLDRPTHDLDILVDRSRENVERPLPVIAARFRSRPPALTADWLSLPEKLVSLPGSGETEVDVLSSCGALDVGAAYNARVEVSTSSGILPVVGLQELIYLKIVSAGRNEHPQAIERDLLDLAALLRSWQEKQSKLR